MDHGRGPAFRRGMDLAHTLCAAVAGGPLGGTEAGRQLRRAAVSVPSLVGEAFVDPGGPEAAAALSQASAKLTEVAALLWLEPVRETLPESERESLLADIEALRSELEELLAGLGGAGRHA